MFTKNHTKSLYTREYKLTPLEVLEIAELSQVLPQNDVAEAYSVSHSTVHFISRGLRWNKITQLKDSARKSAPRKKGFKLTRRKAENIRKSHTLGQSQNSLAKKYKVSQTVIFDIVHGRTHA